VLDIKLIREKPDFVRQRLATRGAGDEARIVELVKFDEQRRKILAEVESLKSQRNRVSKEIGALMGQKKTDEAEAKKAETRELGDKIATYDKLAAGADEARDRLMLQLPNLPHESVPEGKTAEDNREVRVHGEKPTFAFKPKSHIELCESLKLVDFARGAKLSGSGFILYTNWGARLERALIQFLLDLHTTEHGYVEVSPPFMVGPQCLEGVGQFPKFKDQYYGVAEGDDKEKLGKLYLIPTGNCPSGTVPTRRVFEARPAPPAWARAG
jgi:seryl-tRNA synthetase